uniref:Uncharacterized protein n=1 Tax=Cacopsylla melanoneura TaxID=428564 RepID=A0A8D9AIU1_9HEMI
MNKIIVCVLVACLMISISIYFYNFCYKHVYNKNNIKLSELLNNTQVKDGVWIPQTEHSKSTNHISDEDIKYLQDKGWDIHHLKNKTNSRNKRSLASIANCLWRVLNYPYMYNFYPILNFGVSKIMTGLGDLINNVHFPLFSTSHTTSQQPMTDSEQQAQQLAYAQGRDLSQEGTTGQSQDTLASLADDVNYNTIATTQYTTPSQEYPDSREQEEEEEKEKREELQEKLRAKEVNKKIDEKALVLARKYVQMYFSQTPLEDTLSGQNNNDNNLDNVQLPESIENELQNPTTDLYDLNTLTIPNNIPAY